MITLERIKEIEKILSEAHKHNENEIIRLERELEDAKVKRIIACNKNIILSGLEFEEDYKKVSNVINQKAVLNEGKKIKDRAYQILEYHSGQELREKIKESLPRNNKTENIIRIKKSDESGETIENIRQFVKNTNCGKTEVVSCNFETETDNKEYDNKISEILYRMKYLVFNDLIKLESNVNIREEIINQLDTIEFEKLPNEVKKASFKEDLSYEFLDALVCFVWKGNLVFGFIEP